MKSYDYYLCGYHFDDDRLFDAIYRMSKWSGWGMCYEMSALMMLMFINLESTSAVLTRGQYSHCTHSWVEFKSGFSYYVVDPITIVGSHVMSKRKYYRGLGEPKITFTCDIEQFKSYKTAQILAECIKRPETSHILKELRFFRPNFDIEGYPEASFKEDEPTLSNETGKIFLPFRHAKEVVSKEILEEFINDSELSTPSQEAIHRGWEETKSPDERELLELLRIALKYPSRTTNPSY